MKKRILFSVLVLMLFGLLLQSSAPQDKPQGIPPLDTVLLRSPGVDAIVYGGRPTYKWFPVTDATVYDVQMMDSKGDLMDEWQKGVGACDPGPYCIYRIPFDLEQSYGHYQWRVRHAIRIPVLKGNGQLREFSPIHNWIEPTRSARKPII